MNINLIPFPELKTDRLFLRRLMMSDRDALQMLRSDESVNQYLARPKTTSLYETESFIKKIDDLVDHQQSVYWTITLKDENLLIGTACLWHFDHELDMAELGYELSPVYQGKGIMQEAVKAVIKYAFEIIQVKTLTAITDPDNEKSLKLLEKTGFKQDLNYQLVDKDEAEGLAVYYLSSK